MIPKFPKNHSGNFGKRYILNINSGTFFMEYFGTLNLNHIVFGFEVIFIIYNDYSFKKPVIFYVYVEKSIM